MAPENTISAFRRAMEAGCDLVELDVFLTKDRVLMVIHDQKLGRTTDLRGRVEELTVEQLQAADAGTWFTETFKGERVPTLRQVLSVIQGRATPMIEVKQSITRSADLVELLAGDLEATELAHRAILIVWDTETAEAVQQRLPGALISLVCFTRLGVRKASALGLDGVVTYYRSTTRRLIGEAHGLGLFVAPWTVNDPADMDFFFEQGTDVVITDLPELMLDRLERLELKKAREILHAERGMRDDGEEE
jgi:glycerophosphoryl diester phosphodiesterase